MTFVQAFRQCPLVAILRGVEPDEVVALGHVLVEAGFTIIEVPLNSPDPFASIARLAAAFPDRIIGAGTVTSTEAVDRVRDAGGRIILMPHSDGAVIRQAKARGLTCVPGVSSPTEAFAALANGADGLKLFPAEQMPPPVVKAWRAVLPPDVILMPVGGITPPVMAGYRAAGADGFGLGSALYKPGMTAGDLAATAAAFQAAMTLSRPGAGVV
ncbi:MAG: 2-dehydro-3-deoxy-6-phosphogalactonate aldolase [Rhizobiales bacterium]|nr:2-dehydro-3-deoxy-6-phosphogalactonate aldolase [Hyphomicrobiales bacterium]